MFGVVLGLRNMAQILCLSCIYCLIVRQRPEKGFGLAQLLKNRAL
ncbi:hypothetical protein ApDm4_0997 [Acetobacter pomorum]|nr:hypothetical protein ApDm4_0997 [Acetobacter pomorum]